MDPISTLFGLADLTTLNTNFTTLISGFVGIAVLVTGFTFLIAALRKGRSAAR